MRKVPCQFGKNRSIEEFIKTVLQPRLNNYYKDIPGAEDGKKGDRIEGEEEGKVSVFILGVFHLADNNLDG